MKSNFGWTALVIGNSRLHWAQFSGNDLRSTWHTPHLDVDAPLPLAQGELWIASVVPMQRDRWAIYPEAHFLDLQAVPLLGIYPTLGIDRALAVWGAIAQFGSPVLVIDAGTALTLTGADRNHQLVGGAILPGLRLQFQSLNRGTAELPDFSIQTAQFNVQQARWALDTEGAIASGVIHGLLAAIRSFIEDWRQWFPDSAVVITGGDGDRLHGYLQQSFPKLAAAIALDSDLIFWGIQAIRSAGSISVKPVSGDPPTLRRDESATQA